VSGDRRAHSRKTRADDDDVVCAHFSRTSGRLRGIPLGTKATAGRPIRMSLPQGHSAL